MPEQQIPENDPIVSKSYAGAYLIASIILIGTLFWAMWDEGWGQRPWKNYQNEFKTRYVAYIGQLHSNTANAEKDLQNSPEYKELEAQYKQLDQQTKPQKDQINAERAKNDDRLAAVQSVYTDKKALFAAETYDVEAGTFDTDSAKIESDHQKRADKLAEAKKKPQYEIDHPDYKGKKLSYNELEDEYNRLRLEKARLVTELAAVMKPVNEAKAKMDEYISDHLTDLTAKQIDGLRNKYSDWDPKIVQINVADANIVDRCESCHIGTREPLTLTAAAFTAKGKRPDEYARAFVSHPEPELLKQHDPDRFGCSPCHQGNGRATTSAEKAHGTYEHWLWPLFRGPRFDKNGEQLSAGNMEAGCQTCHAADMVTQVGLTGQTVSYGKDLFRVRGCMGCHRYEGYDREPDDLASAAQQIKQVEGQQKDNQKQADNLRAQADKAASNEEANRLNARAEALVVANSKLAGRIEQLDLQSKSLLRDMKKVGPNLKEIRAKINKNWIPVWLHKPTDFRPTTKMPNFRLTDDQIQTISAYLWQSALTDPIDHAAPGDAAHGKELFETRGCMACHSMGEGQEKEGGVFAANLSRVGEKDNYDYLVRWIFNPRHRLRPYCPLEQKDIGPEDYAKHNKPYVFDLQHSTCPNDGHELQVQQMTVMPILRLTQQEAQDIASYLITKKTKDPSSYPQAAFMDDPKLKSEGAKWIRQYGCAGCHEISGFETEGRIGTELTAEGSKPLERLDFALLTETSQRGGREPIDDPDVQKRLPSGIATGRPWYDNQGFFEHKLAMPNVYDKGKIKGPMEALRMPDPHLDAVQINALVTFLLGSQDTSLPASYMYTPREGDPRRDIQEGWWIVRKYNCMGCHQFYPGQLVDPHAGAPTILETLPQYKETREKLPPKLLTEGARVDPEWLLRFLSNPSLSTTDTNRNGVRPYLAVRMPTFNFSPNELRKLVRFFQALSNQPQPYIPQPMPALSAQELDMGRSLFSSQAAPCLKCHATGDPQHDKIATAPNFLLAKERLKPGWTERWLLNPQSISPGTAMPSGLFRKQGDQWVFAGPTPPSFTGYSQDHNKLLVRYIFQLTPEEQRAVAGRMGKSSASAPAPSARKTARTAAPAARTGGR